MASKTRNMLEDLVREGSFKWLIGNRSSFQEECEDLGKSSNGQKNWIPELSPLANVVVRRCSRILGVSTEDLQADFDGEASDFIKEESQHARNFLEYCCFRALALSTYVTGYLADKKFRRLTFDMMLAWESPFAANQQVDEDATVGLEAFCRISPAVPIIANVIISNSLFEVLTASTSDRLQYAVYEKYLIGLERAIKKLKTSSESSLLSVLRSDRSEKILEVDGTVTTQPVLQHIGISAWPGRLTLTNHALYFEPLRVVSYDKAKRYDLADDLKQTVKPELTGPWGTRLFDRAVSYKSISLSEPVILEFPELKGHTRRDYWLAIIQEILLAHRFIRKFQINGVEREELLFKAMLGILRLQALQEIKSVDLPSCDALLIFNLCDRIPGGYLILETLATMSLSEELGKNGAPQVGSGMHSVSASSMAASLGFGFGTSPNGHNKPGLVVGELAVGDVTPLEKVVRESRSNYEKVVLAQESVDGVKVDGIDTNVAVMKELLFPVMELGRRLVSLASWEDPLKSLIFCLSFTYIIISGWTRYVIAGVLLFSALFMIMTRHFNKGRPIVVNVVAPPAKNTVEQLLALQNAVTHAEEAIQDGNIVLLKLRGLMLSIFPQATVKCAAVLLVVALVLAFTPGKYIGLLVLLEAFTRYSPLRRASTERFERRVREWWFSIPAAPVVLERDKEHKKRK